MFCGQLGQPPPVWYNLRRQLGGCGQGKHHERRGGLHGRRQDHCQCPDYVQVSATEIPFHKCIRARVSNVASHVLLVPLYLSHLR